MSVHITSQSSNPPLPQPQQQQDLITFLDTRSKQIFPSENSPSLHLKRTYVYKQFQHRIQIDNVNPSPTTLKDALAIKPGLVKLLSLTPKPPPPTTTTLSSSSLSTTKLGPFESISKCIKRLVLDSRENGITKLEIFDAVSSSTPLSTNQIQHILRRFEQHGIFIKNNSDRYYSSKIIIATATTTTTTTTVKKRRNKSKIKTSSKKRRTSTKQINMPRKIVKTNLQKTTFQGLRLCTLHTLLLLRNDDKSFKLEDIAETRLLTTQQNHVFMSPEWFRDVRFQGNDCTKEELEMLKSIGLIRETKPNEFITVRSNSVTMPIYPGRDLNDTYTIDRNNLKELSEFWCTFRALCMDSSVWHYSNIMWTKAQVMRPPLYATNLDLVELYERRQLKRILIPFILHNTFSRIYNHHTTQLQKSTSLRDATWKLLTLINDKFKYQGDVDSILTSSTRYQDSIYKIISLYHTIEPPDNDSYDILVRDLLFNQKGYYIRVDKDEECENLLRAFVRGGIVINNFIATLSKDAKLLLLNTKVKNTRDYRKETYRLRDYTKLSSDDMDMFSYDEIGSVFEAIRDPALKFTATVKYNNGEERLLRNSNYKKGERARTEWKLDATFKKTNAVVDVKTKKKNLQSSVKSCLCHDFTQSYVTHVLDNVRRILLLNCRRFPGIDTTRLCLKVPVLSYSQTRSVLTCLKRFGELKMEDSHWFVSDSRPSGEFQHEDWV